MRQKLRLHQNEQECGGADHGQARPRLNPNSHAETCQEQHQSGELNPVATAVDGVDHRSLVERGT